jgi:hypothetical protein
VAIRNSNDPGGGFVLNSFGAVQLGLYNPGANAWNQIPAGGQRSMFGVDSTGRVGSLTNTGNAPAYRNLLDDGSGNASIQGRVTASNMPAIAHVNSNVINTGQIDNNSATLIENITINVPADGFLHIRVRAPIYYFYLGTELGVTEVFLELKETTGNEVLIKESYFQQRGVIGLTETTAGNFDMTLDHFLQVSAGQRSFKVRLRHAGNGACYGEAGSQITIMYFPRAM